MAANGRRGPVRGPKANPKAAIQDWLTLVDPDGAFLTPTELTAVFPHGFEPLPAEQRTELRSRVADLGDDSTSPDRADLRRWLLATVLDWGDELAEGQRIPPTATARAAEHGVELRPDQVLLDVEDPNKVRLGVFVWPLGTPLERRVNAAASGDDWPASPVQRAETWCRESGIRLALVTDDDSWAPVWAPRGAPAAACRWRIGDLADERILQSGLISLLGARRFFAVADDETLEQLFVRAANAEAEVTKSLGYSVRQSVELLVAAMSRDDVANDGRVLGAVDHTEVYEAAVTVLMRLVFLLFAEERRLLPAEDPLWAESYSVLTLRDDLRAASVRDGEDALERRSVAWHRLLATFRAVHSGVNHDRLSLPAYGGSLFDPERFAFLEGRHADQIRNAGQLDRPVSIDDRTVLAILDALLTVRVKAGRTKVAQRVSYKALDVEQIGHCYEGLLDHGCARIDYLALGLTGTEGNEPEIAVAEIETHLAGGAEELCEWLSDKARCNRTPSALAQLLERQPTGVDLARLRAACGHDDETVQRVQPFWGLIRPDLRGLPIVLLPGSKFVTQTSTRRNTGAQYTTKALAEEVVQYALEPLVYDPGPQNEADQSKWKLRQPAEILGLRVCDLAVGSGAILTAAGRYLADRLVESVAEYGPGLDSFSARLSDLLHASSDEQTVLARREVVDHCLYGVDKNPVAAEMAKLSLWLTTMARERPFTFLDHAIQVGDSLLGITDMEQLRWLHLEPTERRGKRGFESVAIDLRVKEAADLARRLQSLSVITVRDATEKQRLHDELRAKLADLSIVADAVVGAALSTAGKKGVGFEQRLDTQIDRIRTALDDDRPEIERQAALTLLEGIATGWLRTDLADAIPMPWDRQCLHWPLAFPEVFLDDSRKGFDAVVGNPPFLGGTFISGTQGWSLREHLVREIANGSRGNGDLVSYFLLRATSISENLGLLTTNSIGQGDTREIGLDRVTAEGWAIYRAVSTAPWPNEAGVEIAKIWLSHHTWDTRRALDGAEVDGITSSLERRRRVTGNPKRLAANQRQSFNGSKLYGEGFNMTPAEASTLIDTNPRNAEVLFPYMTGKDLNEHPRQHASRWAINFFDWPIEQARTYEECFEIVERLVRPTRETNRRQSRRERWWRYGEIAPGLYRAIDGRERVLALALISRLVLPAWVRTDQIISHKCGVFSFDDDSHFGILTSAFHWWWAHAWCSTIRSAGLNYSPTDAFETFPRPLQQSGPLWDAIDTAGRELNESRADLMIRTNLGLTKTYNRVHRPDERDPEVERLRELHVVLDHAVRDAYGWSDLELNHHHWETPQGMRFTVSPEAKDELLDRVLELNHERYAEEVAAGLHDKKKAKKTPAKRASKKATNPDQESLL